MQSAQWSDAAAQLMKGITMTGFSYKKKEDARDYLYSQGLNDDTIKRFYIGYASGPRQSPFEQWGIDPDQLSATQRAKGGINIPDGILIPWYVDGQIHKLTVLRPGKTPSYGQILGSTDCLFNGDAIEPDKPALLAESEIQAMRLAQEVGNQITCCAVGKRPTANIVECLNTASFILQCFEDDEQAEHWQSALDRCMCWLPPSDPLQDWLEAGLYCGKIEFGQLCPLHAYFPLAREESPCTLGKDEIIEQFRSKVAELFNSCTVTEIPPDWTPSRHTASLKQRAYWNIV